MADAKREGVSAPSLIHEDAVDLFLDVFPNARVIAADGYDERARAFRYSPNTREYDRASGGVLDL